MSAGHDGVSNRRFFGASLLLSWIAGPAVMFALAGCSCRTSPRTAPA